METEEKTSSNEPTIVVDEKSIGSITEAKKRSLGGTFKCGYCPLEEHYDYKGSKPPFARQIKFTEDCYIMKDPMSLPNRGEVLVIGGDCDFCKKSVCLGCSVFYAKRFCPTCAAQLIVHLPVQLHPKIQSLAKSETS